MNKLKFHIALAFLLIANVLSAQVEIRILPQSVRSAEVFLDNTDRAFTSDKHGVVTIEGLDAAEHVLTIFAEGYATQTIQFNASQKEIRVYLEPLSIELQAVDLIDDNGYGQGMSKLRFIEVDGLYAAKKNEIVLPESMSANRSTNNSRQLFAKVPGINIQETDAGGLQMGVGARGLDPKRTTNFNTRQNGYDISADALGYPESYYTPPIEAVERIELVRGAASLQYGTQFGGLLNFKMKRGSEERPLELTQRTTVGSYRFMSSFTSIGGTKDGWNYYGYYLHKQGSGWRPNSHLVNNGTYIQVGKELGKHWDLELAYTHHFYNAKQPGGLTDRQFEVDPMVSFRERNWFRVNWNIGSATLNGRLTENLTINSKTFVLHSSRAALGFLGNINRIDTGGARDLILGDFNNIGNETRLVQRFDMKGNPGALLIGTRLYRGDTRNRQGKALAGNGPDFSFVNPDALEGSDFDFPSENAAGFVELLLPLSGCWYLTPGVRFEHIRTRSQGYYSEISRHPLTGQLLNEETIESQSDRGRNIALFGMGASWRCHEDIEVYTNISQNYRAMNFSDLYVSNPNLLVARDMVDERGFTADLGVKGSAFEGMMNFDASAFMMRYNDRIGEMLTTIESESGVVRVVNFRDNIADAQFLGVEVFKELNLVDLFDREARYRLAWYNNLALVDARYLNAEVSAFDQKKVENVPTVNYRTGVSFHKNGFDLGVQYNYVSRQYTDATNAEFFPNATVGEILAYSVFDLSASYEWKRIRLEGSVNNLTDEIYFTRRATGYPGPGIIPAERRMFFMTLEFVL